jgi:hypothetical protein
MTGTITKYRLKTGRLSWGYVFTTGYLDGKRQQTIKKGFETKAEAAEALRNALAPKAEGAKAEKVERPFGPFFEEWLNSKGPDWGKMTLEQNLKRGRYAVRLFGRPGLQDPGTGFSCASSKRRKKDR